MTTAEAKTRRRKPVQERSRAKVDAILDAAATVFVERGYAASTTNRIAAAARVSVGSLYEYFPHKDAVLAGLVRRRLRAAAPLDLEPAATAADAVDALVAEALAHYGDDAPLARVVFEEARRSDEARSLLEAAEAERVSGLTQAILARAGGRASAAGVRLAVLTVDALCRRHALDGLPGVTEATLRRELVPLLAALLGSRRDDGRQLGIGGAPAW